MIKGEVYTFWDEERHRSELHMGGHVLYGTNDATLAVMDKILRIHAVTASLKRQISEIDEFINGVMNQWVRE